jgi:hypothetical protein
MDMEFSHQILWKRSNLARRSRQKAPRGLEHLHDAPSKGTCAAGWS